MGVQLRAPGLDSQVDVSPATTANNSSKVSCQDEGSADEDESSGDEEPPLQGEAEDDAAPSVPSLLLVTQKVGLLQLLGPERFPTMPG